MSISGDRALVIGASLAGLSSAAVLARHFREVLVADADEASATDDNRTGAPQSRHVHIMLARGLAEFETLFPGFRAHAIERGAVPIEFGKDLAVIQPNGWAPRIEGLSTLGASRTLYEQCARTHLEKLGNVSFEFSTRGKGVRVVDGRVVGVELRHNGTSRVEEADLVIDASGRSSRGAKWLEDCGIRPPRKTVVNSFPTYSSRWYRRRPDVAWPKEWWWSGAVIGPGLDDFQIGGVLYPVEGDRFVVTLVGLGGVEPPSEPDAFDRALWELRSDIIALAIEGCEPVSPVFRHRQMANRFHHYEREARPAERWIPVGDAVCALNPVYGQGMTVATLCARSLEHTLERQSTLDGRFTRVALRRQARTLMEPWTLSVGADLRLPVTEGEPSLIAKLMLPYMDRVMAAATHDAVVGRRLLRVLHMERPASDLMRPSTVARTVRMMWRHRGEPDGGPRPRPLNWGAE